MYARLDTACGISPLDIGLQGTSQPDALAGYPNPIAGNDKAEG
jgi:hypothetical protein